MTALAILGSATSTSLMSRGRSITTDLPIPSGTKRELASLPTSWITGGVRESAAGARPVAANPNAMSTAISNVMRISVELPMVSFLIVLVISPWSWW